MNSRTKSTLSHAKWAVRENKWLIFRYIYPLLLLIVFFFRITGTELQNPGLALGITIVYYFFAILSIATFFLFEISVFELKLLTVFPVLMALSPVPYETFLIILLFLAVSFKYREKHKSLVEAYLLTCFLVGASAIFIHGIFSDFRSDTILNLIENTAWQNSYEIPPVTP